MFRGNLFSDIRPSSETGARPKTSSLVSSANSMTNSSGGSKQAPLVVNGENKINNEVENQNDDHVRILVDFEFME